MNEPWSPEVVIGKGTRVGSCGPGVRKLFNIQPKSLIDVVSKGLTHMYLFYCLI